MTLEDIQKKYGVKPLEKGYAKAFISSLKKALGQNDASDKKADALKLFEQRKKQALQLAKKIEGKIGKFSSQPYPYPAAASLGRVVELLQEIDRFLG